MSYEDKTTTTLDGRKATPEAQLELRRRCIVYFRDGVKRAEIARRLGLSRQWVTKIIKIYQTEGFDSAVAGKKRGLNEAAASEKRRLSREEEKKVANWIGDKNPAQLKFDFALWTAKAVRQLIYREFGRQLDLSTVHRYLRSWGMTPQRPKKKAIQQDDAAVQRWLETDYPAIAERAKKEKATIFWEDETAVQQDTNWIRGYAPRGKTPTILHDRRACYGAPVMISAVNNQGLSAFAFQRSAVRRYSFIRFLHRLIKDYGGKGRKLFVICDNCRIHHAKLVAAWCEAHKEEIELFFLPSYSPELNPDEFLNRQLKTSLRVKGRRITKKRSSTQRRSPPPSKVRRPLFAPVLRMRVPSMHRRPDPKRHTAPSVNYLIN